jgi:tetratricopeptide (TPR) repeat protein
MPGYNKLLKIILCCSLLLFVPMLAAQAQQQQTGNYEAERERAFEFTRAGRYGDALPILEKLAAAKPNDAQVLEQLGIAVLAKSEAIKDEEARRLERKRGREILVRAKELGANGALLMTALEGIPPDGSTISLSANKDAEEALREGEAAFQHGQYDKALAAYERAFKLDPKLYEAALFAGDVYFNTKRYEKAGEWFARAVALKPDREQAHRFWGDALLALGKMDAARDRFIDAALAEPDNRLVWEAFNRWAEKNNVTLAHPEIDVLAEVKIEDEKNISVYINPDLRESTDGSRAWEFYALTRVEWITKQFPKEFPNEQGYRHTLREETAALLKVIETAGEDLKSGKVKSLSPSLANLIKVNQAGLLEAYVLLARADDDILVDYEDYRKNNRDKLKRYLTEFVISKK